MIFSENSHTPTVMYSIVSCKNHIYNKQKKSLKINLTVNVNKREIAGQNFCNHDNTCRRRFLSISGQKYAEIGIELGLANVLDNFSFSFVFSIKNEGVIEVFSKITLKTSRDRKYVAPCCAHTPYDYFDFNLNSQGRKLAEKLYFFVKFMYVTFCDLQGHHRSQVMV